MKKEKNDVCSAKLAGTLDNSFRRIIHNPDKIFDGLINEDDVILDIGAGPGTFTIDLAKKTTKNGYVIAIDLQQEMLDKLKVKAASHGITEKIQYHKCNENSLGISCKANFALAFYMVHEVPDKKIFFQEVYDNLKDGGTFLFVEPKIHVSNKMFEEELNIAKSTGFKILEKRKIFFSNAFLLKK
jgi:ubiquinone/menaquinone biosynthesis C-methylase UbiE